MAWHLHALRPRLGRQQQQINTNRLHLRVCEIYWAVALKVSQNYALDVRASLLDLCYNSMANERGKLWRLKCILLTGWAVELRIEILNLKSLLVEAVAMFSCRLSMILLLVAKSSEIVANGFSNAMPMEFPLTARL